jgi:NCAIR mutase (PurE)-related protein
LGLEIESLQDLSWTDPSLEVQDCAWYPEEKESQTLPEYKEFGEETLTIDADRKVVVSSKAIVSMSAEKIAQIQANKAAALQAKKESLVTQISDLQIELESL